MINSAWKSVKDADITLLMLDADNDLDNNTLIIADAFNSKQISNSKFLICVINKIDLVKDSEVKKIIEDFSKNFKSEIITLSTFEKKSVSKIKAKLISYAS